MKIYIDPYTVADDDFPVHVNPGNERPFAIIEITDGFELWSDSPADCDRLIKAGAEAKRKLEAAIAGAPHGFQPDARHHCEVCGTLRNDERHAEPATEAKRLPDPPARTDAPRLLGDPICAVEHSSGVVCTEAPGHGDADHIAKDVWGSVVHRWPAVADDGQPPFAAVPRLTRVKRPADDGQTYSDEPAPAATRPSWVGRLVHDAHDDSPCPTVGKVVGQVDEDTVEVLWGERQFEESPGTGSYEPLDALRPANSKAAGR